MTTQVGQWHKTPETGSAAGIVFIVRLATMFGRAPARVFVRVLAFYFTIFNGQARRAAADFRRHVGAPSDFWSIYRHIRAFAYVALDSLFLMRGMHAPFEITRDGHQHLAALRDGKRGALLLGAHIGSLYAMRAQSRSEQLVMHPLMFIKNAARFNTALKKLDPASETEVIQIEEGNPTFILRLRDLIERGEMLAILADRVPATETTKTVEVDFLGGKIRLPSGPYLLAASLKCPTYFVAGIYRDPNRYELHCEPFADPVVLPRGDRMGAAQTYAQQYADVVARYCRDAPDNWFNFFPYWESK